MSKAAFLFLALFLFLINPVSIFTQEIETGSPNSALTLYVGEMKPVATDTPSRVVIGNPNIADIISVNTKEIILAGKGAGATNLIWWDASGEKSLRVKVLTEDMSDVKSRVDGLLKELGLSGVFTRTADSEGTVLVMGNVKTQEDADRIKTALGPLYAKTTNLVQVNEEKAIVELDVEVLEVNKDSTKDLGVRWPSGAVFSSPANHWMRMAELPDALFRVTEWTRSSAAGDQLQTTLGFLIKEGKARILSRPRLACQSGKEAELLVGGEKPIMTTQSVSGGGTGTSVEYKEYGIKLKMAPVIAEDKKIKLSLNVEVSDVGTAETLGSSSTGTTTARAYPLIKRSTATQLYLADGQTLAISGLIRQKSEEDLQKFPWLGDVPVLGMFFRHRSTKHGGGAGERGDTELVIMITPSVLSDKAAVKQEVAKESKSQVAAEETQKTLPEKKAKKISPKKTVARKKLTKETKSEEQAEMAVSETAAEMQPLERPLAAESVSADELKEQVLAAYVQEVANYIALNLEYPWAGRQGEIEGAVKLALHLSESGEILDINVDSSSGSSLLDENTLRIARQISPYPSFPQGIAEEDLWIQVPIVYNLKE